MRTATFLSIAGGCLTGLILAYFIMTPFIDTTREERSILEFDPTSILTLRGIVESVDADKRELVILVSYPGSPQEKAPFRIPFDAVDNYINGSIKESSAEEVNARNSRYDIRSTTAGQPAILRLRRTPGSFRVLSLGITVPPFDNL